jgi:TolA-binding protein
MITGKVIDSRDLIILKEELEEQLSYLQDEVNELKGDNETPADKLEEKQDELREWLEEHKEELDSLIDICDEGELLSSDWEHGESLIREDYWVEYCKELVTDIGDLPKDVPFYIEIDWDKTAENISQDYSTIDIDGETYYIRST